RLAPGQPVVGLRERNIRSNGLTDVRAILDQAYLQREMGVADRRRGIAAYIRSQMAHALPEDQILAVLDAQPNATRDHEQILLPWHTAFQDLTTKLQAPSTIYAPLIYEAQGGVDGERRIPLVDCTHVSGGGSPLKARRMVENQGDGVNLEAIFPDPEGVEELI